MRILEKELPADHDIVLATCSHEGALGQDKEGFLGMLEWVREGKNRYLIHLGDYVEAITVDDKRYDSRIYNNSVLQQYTEVLRNLEPIADKILVLLEGNHDATIARRISDFVDSFLCHTLEVCYGTYTTVLEVTGKEDKTMYKVFLTHGSGMMSSGADDPLRKRANLKLNLKRKLSLKMSDCEVMAMGHTHRLLTIPPTEWLKLYTQEGRIKSLRSAPKHEQFIHPDNRWYVNAGSFYKLYAEEGPSGYAERGGYDPLDLGYAVLEVRGGVLTNVREVIL